MYCCLSPGDGVISVDELSQGLSAQGGIFTPEELQVMMKETDVDGSGAIDYEEFLAATVNLSLLEREEVLQKLFIELDAVSSYCSAFENALNKIIIGDNSMLRECLRLPDF